MIADGLTTQTRSRNVAGRARARKWYDANRLDWTVRLHGQVVARFANERDARGFAIARYGREAEVAECLRRRARKARGYE